MAGSGLLSNAGPIKPHLIQGPHGQAAEINDIRTDLTAQIGALLTNTVEELTAPAAASTNALLAAFATPLVGVLLVQQEKDLLTAGKAALRLSPRRLVYTTAGGTAANAPASVVIEGLDNFGKPVKETLALAQTATTATSVNVYSKINRLTYAVGEGASATLALGWSVALYVTKKPKARTGLVLIRELMDGAEIAPATGTLTTAGLYTPAAAPNATHNYAIYFEYDPIF